jgi:hypothetical protein
MGLFVHIGALTLVLQLVQPLVYELLVSSEVEGRVQCVPITTGEPTDRSRLGEKYAPDDPLLVHYERHSC